MRPSTPSRRLFRSPPAIPPRRRCRGGTGLGGNGSGNGNGGADSDLSITVTDGGIVPDGGMPTNCTVGPSGALGLVPVETMAPGTACVTCHLAIGKPLYIAGTVYPANAPHDADLCLGITGVQVEIVDANGGTHLYDVNSSGNFLDASLLELWPSPWTVATVKGSARRPMVGTVTSGDCNAATRPPAPRARPAASLRPTTPHRCDYGKVIRPGAELAPLWVWQLLQSPLVCCADIARVLPLETTCA